MKKAILLIWALVLAQMALAQNPVRDSLLYEGAWRTHYVFIPETLLPQRPLIVMLHGYGGKAEGYRPEMLEAASRAGFAVCVPQGLKAPEGKTGWYAGYPAQKGMRQDDDDFICFLAREVAKKHGLDESNLFLTGMSNGGEMCYIIGRKYPQVFGAIASVAGLTMKWVADERQFHGPVPFMEIHGTADKTSRWEGDLQNEGGWGEYIAVPDAVEAWIRENGCCAQEETVSLSPLSTVSLPVVLHWWKNGRPSREGGPATEVLLYEVIGGGHSWALKDMDTCGIICDFFTRWLQL